MLKLLSDRITKLEVKPVGTEVEFKKQRIPIEANVRVLNKTGSADVDKILEAEDNVSIASSASHQISQYDLEVPKSVQVNTNTMTSGFDRLAMSMNRQHLQKLPTFSEKNLQEKMSVVI
ncbi:CLUMA_CG007067, isoform A [Clunio marinus]|uniref:CLUMA_CG007067, isoform A n=1 Tax=Clunio marinus TaxID=568069 RepID=A0A1J1I3U3_9DIPT|nr:CLUMA_CG007067, isoform A [Clunio marinus]